MKTRFIGDRSILEWARRWVLAGGLITVSAKGSRFYAMVTMENSSQTGISFRVEGRTLLDALAKAAQAHPIDDSVREVKRDPPGPGT